MNGTSGFQAVRSSPSPSPYRFLDEQRHQFGTGSWHLLHTHYLIALFTGISTKRNKVATSMIGAFLLVSLGAFLTGYTLAEESGPPSFSVFSPLPPQELDKLNQQAMAEVKKSTIRSNSVIGIHHVKLDAKKLFDEVFPKLTPADPSVAPLVEFILTKDASVFIVTDRVKAVDGSRTWVGHIQNNLRSSALFMANTKTQTISGEIRTDGIVYEIKPGKNDSYAIFAVDTRRLPPDHSSKGDRKLLVSRAPRELLTFTNGDGAPRKLSPVLIPGISPVIDVMVLYTQAAIGADTSEAIALHICKAMQQVEESFTNSGVTIPRIRLVHHEKIDFPESGDLETDAKNLRDPSFPQISGIPDYHPKRKLYGADLVSLWVSDGQGCGSGEPIVQPGGSGTLAFSAVRRNCATTNMSFAHELGHLMGSYHDRFYSSADGDSGHNYGYIKPDATPPWKTMMAEDNSDCPKVSITLSNGTTIQRYYCERVPYWSNPDKEYPPGSGDAMGRPVDTPITLDSTSNCKKSTGDPSLCDGPAHNTRTLNDNAQAVSEFMPTGILGTISCGDTTPPAPPVNVTIQ